jgi:hypothetical protein
MEDRKDFIQLVSAIVGSLAGLLIGFGICLDIAPIAIRVLLFLAAILLVVVVIAWFILWDYAESEDLNFKEAFKMATKNSKNNSKMIIKQTILALKILKIRIKLWLFDKSLPDLKKK